MALLFMPGTGARMAGPAEASQVSLSLSLHDLSMGLHGLRHSMAISGKLDSLHGFRLFTESAF